MSNTLSIMATITAIAPAPTTAAIPVSALYGDCAAWLQIRLHQQQLFRQAQLKHTKG